MPEYNIGTSYVVCTGGHLKRRRVVLSDFQMVDGDRFIGLQKKNREVARLIGLSYNNMYKTKLHMQMRELRNRHLNNFADIAEGVADDIDIGIGDDEDMPAPTGKRNRDHRDLPATIDVTCPSVDPNGEDVVIKMLPTTMFRSACVVLLHHSTIDYLMKCVQRDVDEYDRAVRQARPVRDIVDYASRDILDYASRNLILCRWRDGMRLKTKIFKYASPEEKREQEINAQEFMTRRENS